MIFAWWNTPPSGRLLTTWFRGTPVGTDEFGNRYYQNKDGKRRWVLYNGTVEACRVPPDWHGWLHHTFDEPPTKTPLQGRNPGKRTHLPNLTGTDGAYRPDGSLAEKRRASARHRRLSRPGSRNRRMSSNNTVETHDRRRSSWWWRSCSSFFAYTRTGSGSARRVTSSTAAHAARGRPGGRHRCAPGRESRSARCRDLTLDPKNYLVTVHMNIRDDIKIPDDSSLMVTSSGLLGSSYLSISPGGSDKMLAAGRRDPEYARAPST